MLTLLRLIKSVRLVGLYLYIFINAFDTVPHFPPYPHIRSSLLNAEIEQHKNLQKLCRHCTRSCARVQLIRVLASHLSRSYREESTYQLAIPT